MLQCQKIAKETRHDNDDTVDEGQIIVRKREIAARGVLLADRHNCHPFNGTGLMQGDNNFHFRTFLYPNFPYSSFHSNDSKKKERKNRIDMGEPVGSNGRLT